VLRWLIEKMPGLCKFKIWVNYITSIAKCNKKGN
jgi:hypothetical protein